MTFVDHLFVMLLFIVQPILGALSYRRYLRRIKAGYPADRIEVYLWTGIIQWLALAALTALWFWQHRPYSDLGFVPAGGFGFFIGIAILVGMCGVLLYSWRRSKQMTADEKSSQIRAMGDLVHLLPRNKQDLRAFFGLSLTAGIVEEIIYRGFVIWYLGLVMPVWAAIVISSILFGLGHTYQGVGGAIKTGFVGLLFGVFYVLTGSIWLPIVGHILFDALQGLTILEIQRGPESSDQSGQRVQAEA